MYLPIRTRENIGWVSGTEWNGCGWEWGRRDGDRDTPLGMCLCIFLTFRVMLMFPAVCVCIDVYNVWRYI